VESFESPIEDEVSQIESNIESENRTTTAEEEDQPTGDDSSHLSEDDNYDREPSEIEDLDEWEEVEDPSSDGEKSYFYNRKTGETSWDRPTGMQSKAKSSPDSPSERDNQTSEDTDKGNDDLLEGWIEVADPSSGDSYWFNSETNETTWEKPSRSANNHDDGDILDDWVDVQEPKSEEEKIEHEPEPEPETLDPTLPEGWTESTDPSTGQIFYWNESTGETSWERPGDCNSPSTKEENRPTTVRNDKADEPIVMGSGLEIENERRKFGIMGPFTPCDDSAVIEYINSKGKSDDMLWQLISIAARSRGRLRSEYGVVDKSSPEAAIVNLLLGDSACGGLKVATPRRKKKRSDIIVEEESKCTI